MMHMQNLIDKFLWKVSDNANAIRFVAFILQRISANMERKVSKYQQLLAYLDHLMDGIDTIFRFAFTYHNSTRQTGRIIRLCENKIDKAF